jgi:hypothetical protein
VEPCACVELGDSEDVDVEMDVVEDARDIASLSDVPATELTADEAVDDVDGTKAIEEATAVAEATTEAATEDECYQCYEESHGDVGFAIPDMIAC